VRFGLACRTSGCPPTDVIAGAWHVRSKLWSGASSSAGAPTGPVLLVLDDVHWADQPSLLLLRHLARELREVRLLVVATYRTTRADTTAGWRAVLSDLIREPLTEQVELSGLSAADTARCAEAVSDRPLSGAVGAALHSMTGGNPFFVREVARSLAISAGSDVTVPASVIDLITARVERLSPLTRRLLGAAAVLGEQFAVAIAASNHEVASALFLSQRTAQNHVQHILTKLGFSNRSQITSWVIARQPNE